MTTNTVEAGTGARTSTSGETDSQERKAERLLKSTAARNYDPDLDIDWQAPLDETLPFMRPERSSLYGTEIWERLTAEQRITLLNHEAASVASVGLWFENILIQLLAKVTYNGDPTSARNQYALAEIAEECRHMTMFARMVTSIGAPAYGVTKRVHRLGKLLPLLAHGEVIWAATLIGEEIPDRLQREIVDDPGIQPLMRMVNRIHIMEEARHIGFARQELARALEKRSRLLAPLRRMLLAHIAFIVSRSLINPEVYRSVGLEPRAARKVALANPHFQRTMRWAGEKLVAELDDAGLLRGPGMRWWKASFLVA